MRQGKSVFQLRYLILIVSTACLTLIIANILSLQFTIICMLDEDSMGGFGGSDTSPTTTSTTTTTTSTTTTSMSISNSAEDDIFGMDNYNKTTLEIRAVPSSSAGVRAGSCAPDGIHFGGRFKWSKHIQSTIYSAFAWGSLVATLPISWLLQNYGTRKILTCIGLISSVATILSPIAAYQGYWYFIACRVFMGISYTCLFPAMGAITTHWATLKENGLFLGMLGSATQLTPVIAMPIAGYLCSTSYGWPLVFYVHGVMTLFVFGIWAMLYKNDPRDHPLITRDELERIEFGKSGIIHGSERKRSIPYRDIIRSLPVLAIMFAALSNMSASQTVLLFTPTYLKTVLKFDMQSVSLLSTLPTLFQFFVKIIGGFASDWLPMRDTMKIKIFNSLALFGMGIFVLALSYVPPSQRYLALAMLVSSMAFLGFHSGGFFKSVTLVSLEFAPIVMGLVQLTDTLIWLLAPYIINGMAPNGTYEEWRYVFFGNAGLLGITGVIFCIFGSGIAEPWAVNPMESVPGTALTLIPEEYITLDKHGIRTSSKKSLDNRSLIADEMDVFIEGLERVVEGKENSFVIDYVD